MEMEEYSHKSDLPLNSDQLRLITKTLNEDCGLTIQELRILENTLLHNLVNVPGFIGLPDAESVQLLEDHPNAEETLLQTLELWVDKSGQGTFTNFIKILSESRFYGLRRCADSLTTKRLRLLQLHHPRPCPVRQGIQPNPRNLNYRHGVLCTCILGSIIILFVIITTASVGPDDQSASEEHFNNTSISNSSKEPKLHPLNIGDNEIIDQDKSNPEIWVNIALANLTNVNTTSTHCALWAIQIFAYFDPSHSIPAKFLYNNLLQDHHYPYGVRTDDTIALRNCAEAGEIKSLSTLESLGVITIQSEDGVISIPKDVQGAIRHSLNRTDEERVLLKGVGLLDKSISALNSTSDNVTDSLLHHAKTILGSYILPSYDLITKSIPKFTLSICEALTYMGNNTLSFAKQVATKHEQIFGTYSNETTQAKYYVASEMNKLDSANQQALSLIETGQVRKALEIYDKIVPIYLSNFGLDSVHYLVTLNNKATCLADLGEFAKALEAQGQVYQAYLKMYGPDHRETLYVRYEMGVTYTQMGRWAEALVIFREVVAKESKVLGPNNPDALESSYSLGVALNRLGYTKEALATFRDVYDRRKQVLGETHADTRKTMDQVKKLETISS